MNPQLHCPKGLEYDPVLHAYKLDGREVPAVSTLLKIVDPDQYSFVRAEVLDRARERGSDVHAMIALDVRGQLDVAELSEERSEDYLAWQKFCDDTGFTAQYSEQCVFSRKFQFAGTLDLAGRLAKHKRLRGTWLIDVKRVAAEPTLVGPQTAGYGIAAAESLPDWDPETPRGVLWLRGKDYRFIECPRQSDRAVFLAASTIHHWRNLK